MRGSTCRLLSSLVLLLLLTLAACDEADPLVQRKLRALQVHISKPWPKVSPDDCWGVTNLALARLALNGTSNATIATEVSLDVESWTQRFMPWNNYSVKGPMGGLGCLNILARMSLKLSLREALSSKAVDALDEIFFAWLSPRSRVDWAGASNSWLVLDGSENLVSCPLWMKSLKVCD